MVTVKSVWDGRAAQIKVRLLCSHPSLCPVHAGRRWWSEWCMGEGSGALLPPKEHTIGSRSQKFLSNIKTQVLAWEEGDREILRRSKGIWVESNDICYIIVFKTTPGAGKMSQQLTGLLLRTGAKSLAPALGVSQWPTTTVPGCLTPSDFRRHLYACGI